MTLSFIDPYQLSIKFFRIFKLNPLLLLQSSSKIEQDLSNTLKICFRLDLYPWEIIYKVLQKKSFETLDPYKKIHKICKKNLFKTSNPFIKICLIRIMVGKISRCM
jgi:hypothetical protein